jgi:hypothetical protein
MKDFNNKSKWHIKSRMSQIYNTMEKLGMKPQRSKVTVYIGKMHEGTIASLVKKIEEEWNTDTTERTFRFSVDDKDDKGFGELLYDRKTGHITMHVMSSEYEDLAPQLHCLGFGKTTVKDYGMARKVTTFWAVDNEQGWICGDVLPYKNNGNCTVGEILRQGNSNPQIGNVVTYANERYVIKEHIIYDWYRLTEL